MKKPASFMIVLLFVGFGVLGASRGAYSAEGPGTIYIGTHPLGSFYYVIGTAIAKVIEEHTSLKAKVLPLSGPTAWMPMMLAHEVDCGVANSIDANWGYLGIGAYGKISGGKGFPVRLVLTGVYNDNSMVTGKDSGIKTIPDLRGRKVAAGYTSAPAVERVFEAQLANGGLSIGDIKLVPAAAPPPAVRMVIEGRADAAGVATAGMPVVKELEAKKGALFLPLNPSPEAMARTRKIFPYSWAHMVKGGLYAGIDQNTWLLRFEDYFVCRADLPDETVQTILKALWDYNKDLGKVNRRFKGWNREHYVSKYLSVPYHRGAVTFFKEKGLYTPEQERAQRELLDQKKVSR